MNSDEYEKLAKRITEVESTLDGFVAKFMSLRGLIHRKGFADIENPEESKSEGNKKSDVLVPSEHGI